MKDDNTTIKQLQEIAERFSNERDWDQYHNPKDLAIGAITEAAELLEPFRFKSEEQMYAMLEDPAKREHIGDELADTLYCIVRMAQKCGIDLSSAFEKKVEKNAKKYPIDKAKGQNKKYTEL